MKTSKYQIFFYFLKKLLFIVLCGNSFNAWVFWFNSLRRTSSFLFCFSYVFVVDQSSKLTNNHVLSQLTTFHSTDRFPSLSTKIFFCFKCNHLFNIYEWSTQWTKFKTSSASPTKLLRCVSLSLRKFHFNPIVVFVHSILTLCHRMKTQKFKSIVLYSLANFVLRL